MTLGQPSDGWVTGHEADGIDIHGHQQRWMPQTRCRKCCFDAGMTTANDDYIISIITTMNHERKTI